MATSRKPTAPTAEAIDLFCGHFDDLFARLAERTAVRHYLIGLLLPRERNKTLTELAALVPGISNYEVAHATLYKVHQRVAKTFQRGRVFLAGDAAHVNNPLGGMGMNGGIHDAINLTSRLIEVWHGIKPEAELERYDRQRRAVTLEYIEQQSIQNKRNLESDGIEFGRRLKEIAADKTRTHDYLVRVSMIASLRRAQELG